MSEPTSGQGRSSELHARSAVNVDRGGVLKWKQLLED